MCEQRNKMAPQTGGFMAEPSLKLAALAQHVGSALDRNLSLCRHSGPLTARGTSSLSFSDMKAVIKPGSPCARGEMIHSRCTV